VDVDAAAGLEAVGARNRDVDGAFDGFEELPERGGGVVAEDCSVPASENRGHPAPVPTRSAMTHCVDAAVEAVQAPTAHPSRCCAFAHAKRFELSQRDDSVLLRSDSREA